MTKTLLKVVSLVTLLILVRTATAQDARAVLANTTRALGAENLRTLVYSGTATEFAFGQAWSPSSPWPGYKSKSYTTSTDLQRPAWRIDRVLDATSPSCVGCGGAQQDRGGAIPPGPSDTVVIDSGTHWADYCVLPWFDCRRHVDFWDTPYGFLKAAAANNAGVKSQTIGGKKYTVVTFTGQNKAAVNGYINDQNTLEKVETWVDSPFLGDTLLEVSYSGYKDFDGVKFPTRIVKKQGGHPVLDLLTTDVKTNVPVNIQAPAAQPAATPESVQSEKIADGVYWLKGGHSSVGIAFKDHVVMIDAPLDDQRTSAVMIAARSLIPNKSIRYVVNTHHHFDHAGGLRAYAAEGVTIVTHEINKQYYEKVFAMAHTLNPDKLARFPKKPAFETFTQKKVMTDGVQTLELYVLNGNIHNQGIVMAYLPNARMAIVVDVYNSPPTPSAPANVASLLDTIDKLKLNVERILPLHGSGFATRADLLKAVGRTAN
jgi:glyoxylase-like metal-dependent hydrolase (beta-lactamase superfamily II)